MEEVSEETHEMVARGLHLPASVDGPSVLAEPEDASLNLLPPQTATETSTAIVPVAAPTVPVAATTSQDDLAETECERAEKAELLMALRRLAAM